MTRVRLSITVNRDLLDKAQAMHPGTTDAALVDEPLRALIARHRSPDVVATYAAYDEHPLGERDLWGDLETFRRAAAAS